MTSAKELTRPTWLTIFCLSSLLILLVSHMPFLYADADLSASPGSRGPWTDEGLNTSQIRNFINHNHFDLLECDNFLKTPLFSAFLFVPLSVFGTELEVARLAVVSLVFLSLIFFLVRKSLRLVLGFLIMTTLMLFPIHQHTHFSLAEMCTVAMVILAGFNFMCYIESDKTWCLIVAFVFLLLAVLFKIQLVYVLFIPPLAILFKNSSVRLVWFNKRFFMGIGLLLICFGMIFFLWYLPFKNEWQLIANMQSGSFSLDTLSWYNFNKNIHDHFINEKSFFFTLCFIIAFFIGIRMIFLEPGMSRNRGLLMFSFVWCILEFHKLPMFYLPVRYMISFYFSMGFLISIVGASLLICYEKRIIHVFTLASIVLLLVMNVRDYYLTLTRRTYAIDNMNEYFATCNLNDKTVMGAWAPSLTWKCKSLTFPIWRDFLRTSDPLLAFSPAVIVSELDEEDSNQAYQALGIHLEEYADSIKRVQIANWAVNVYWMNQNAIMKGNADTLVYNAAYNPLELRFIY